MGSVRSADTTTPHKRIKTMATATEIKTLKVTRIILNYAETNILGNLVDWGNKPGRLVSVSYVLEEGYVAVKNTRWPMEHTMEFYKNGKFASQDFRYGTHEVDWTTKKTAPRSNRMVAK